MEDSYDIAAMKERLALALKKAGISHNAASLKAGASTGYVHSILSGNADPGTIFAAQPCQNANVVNFDLHWIGGHQRVQFFDRR